MDRSETYIKMCEKAEPDLIFQTPRLLEDTHNYWASRGKGIPSPHPIWLPRQDQLQEMVAVKNSTYANIEPFADFAIRQGIRSMSPQFRSMEQLWLAFVMKEKYQKIWNIDSWIST